MNFKSHQDAINFAKEKTAMYAPTFHFNNTGFEAIVKQHNQDGLFNALCKNGFTCKKSGKASVKVVFKSQDVERLKILSVEY